MADLHLEVLVLGWRAQSSPVSAFWKLENVVTFFGGGLHVLSILIDLDLPLRVELLQSDYRLAPCLCFR